MQKNAPVNAKPEIVVLCHLPDYIVKDTQNRPDWIYLKNGFHNTYFDMNKTKFIRQANLPPAAYSHNSGLEYFAQKSNSTDDTWCRSCGDKVYNEKVREFSIAKYGKIKCWKCQQKNESI